SLHLRTRQCFSPFPYTTLFRSSESAEAGKPANTASAPTQQLNPDEPLTQEQFEQIDPEIREQAYLDTLTEMGVPYSTEAEAVEIDRKSTRLNSSHVKISYAVFC